MKGGEVSSYDNANNERSSIMDNASIDGTPFSVLMSQAVKLKTAQEAPSRSIYDKYPTFYKNSIYPREEVMDARKKPFQERMNDAIHWKNIGNKAIGEKHYAEAITNYEIAISIFKYLENSNSDWKTQGIRDEDVVEIKFKSQNESEMNQVQLFLITCYINIAVVSLKAKNFSLVIDACNEVLQNHNPSHVKALYLRSKALVTPKSAGSTEDDIAIKDLTLALHLEPDNKLLRKEIATLKSRRKDQLHRDRKSFGGMFERGLIYEDIDDPKKIKAGTKNCGNTSRLDVTNEIHFDFDNPSAKMVEEASRRGIDLTDMEVVKVLKKLQLDRSSSISNSTGCSASASNDSKQRRKNEHKQPPRLHSMILYFLIAIMSYYLRRKWREIISN